MNPMTSGEKADAKKFFHAPQTKKALPIDDCKSPTNGSKETIQALYLLYTLLGEYPFKNRNTLNNLVAQFSSKSEDRSQQARIPAPAIDNIDTNHDIDAKKVAHAPPVCLECDHSTLRLGNLGNEDLNPMTSGKQADTKKFFHAPQTKKALPIDDRKSPTNGSDELPIDDCKIPNGRDETILQQKKRIAGRSRAKKIFPADSYNSTGGAGDGNPANDDLNTMTPEEKADAKKLAHTPPIYLESDQANPGAFRVGGQDNNDGNTITYGEEVSSHGATTDAFQVVSARLVEEDPEETIAVAVVAKDERGNNKKRLIYLSVGVLVIFVVLLQLFLE